MSTRLLALSVFFLSVRVLALTGIEDLIDHLNKQNQEILSLEKIAESKEAQKKSADSVYYPTLNIVGGWGQNKTDELPTVQKGYLGYAEGKFNLFHGFRDQSITQQKSAEAKIALLNVESKKNSLKVQLTEIMSEMILLHHLQSILNDEYKMTQTQKQMAIKKVSAGLTGTVDNLEFDLRENEIQMEQKQIDQQHVEAHQKLLSLYGQEIADTLIDNIKFGSIESLSQMPTQLKIETTLEYQKANLDLDLAQFEKNEVTSDYKPSLDFSYSFGRLTPSEDSSAKLNESKYAIQLTIPLFSGFETYNKTKAASANISSIEKNKKQQINNIQSEYNVLRGKIVESISMYNLVEKKITHLEKYFDLTLSEYKRGVKNSPDLVSATERLFGARKKKYELLKDLEILKARIERFI